MIINWRRAAYGMDEAARTVGRAFIKLDTRQYKTVRHVLASLRAGVELVMLETEYQEHDIDCHVVRNALDVITEIEWKRS